MRELLVLSKGADAPSTRYRATQYFSRLEAAGYRARHLDLAGRIGNYASALAAARRADVVLVLRKTLPSVPLWALRQCSKRLVFDLDDAIFCNTDGSSSGTRMSRFARMASICDRVLAGNDFLAEVSQRFNPDVDIIPTAVDVGRYVPSAEKAAGVFDAVWIGSSSTRKYLEEAIPALRLAATRIPGLRLKIIADFDLGDPGFPTLPVRWKIDSEASELASSHIGIAPMRNDDWSRGKCALKVLQYMAAGLPVISSPVGVNGQAVLPGQTGYLPRDTAGWVEALVALANDPLQAIAFGQAGRERVESHYSLARVSNDLVAALDKACH